MDKFILFASDQCRLDDCIVDDCSDCQILRIRDDWHLVHMDTEFLFGRNLGLSHHVSSRHFRIHDHILEDLSSTNGTFVNGRKVSQIHLQDGDWIQVAQYTMYVFGSYLVVNCRIPNSVQGCECQKEPIVSEWSLHHQTISFQPETITMSLQAPHCMEQPKKPKWNQALGPSLSILLSGGLMSLGYYLFKPEQKNQISTMALTNASMFIAFLLYGLINGRVQYSQQKKMYESNDQKYETYLQSLETQINEAHLEINQAEIAFQKLCACTQETYGIQHPLLVGKTMQPWIQLNYSEPSYEQIDHPLYQKIQTLAQSYCQPILRCLCLQPNQSVWIQSNDSHIGAYLFSQWIWQRPEKVKKWIWLDPDMNLDARYFAFENCRNHHQFLLAKEEDKMHSLLDHFHPSDCIVFSTIPIKEKIDTTIILCTTQPVSIPVDHIVTHTDTQSCDLRSIAYGTPSPFTFWESIQTAKPSEFVTLKVPISDDIWIDLDEKAQGPHILVAGMTGSGKSEWISALLLQLIVRNRSDQLQYILVDFKGGAFGQAFYQFGHCAGMVTNLESGSVERLLDSLRYEVKHRQEILRNFVSNHPNQIAHIDIYNQNHKEPMSHVLVIMDEFAQFKMRYPEAMNEIKELARIGRSIGLHLILATQKPSGIVDEQIWSNCRLRVCLKVNSEADSREVIHSSKAAHLKQVGSFIGLFDNQYVQGQGFWIHETKPQNDWMAFDHRGNKLAQKNNSATTFQHVSNALLSQPQTNRWIVLPDLKGQVIQGMWLDQPWLQKQVSWIPKEHEKILVYYEQEIERDEWLLNLVSMMEEKSMMAIHLPVLDGYVSNTSDADIILIEANAHTDLKRYLSKPSMVVVCISSYWIGLDNLRGAWDFIVSLRWQNIDMVRSVFHTFHIPKANQGLVQMDDRFAQLYYGKNKPKKLATKHPISFPIHSTIAWKQEHPLCILYAQQSSIVWIQERIQTWLVTNPLLIVQECLESEADIYVCNVLDCMDMLTGPVFLKKQYDLDLLWVGLGYAEYAYLIHRIAPSEPGDMYFWQGRQVWSLQNE